MTRGAHPAGAAIGPRPRRMGKLACRAAGTGNFPGPAALKIKRLKPGAPTDSTMKVIVSIKLRKAVLSELLVVLICVFSGLVAGCSALEGVDAPNDCLIAAAKAQYALPANTWSRLRV